MKKQLFILGLLFSPFAFAVQALTIQPVAPGIYVHFGPSQRPNTANHGEIANIGFIIGKRCVAVIDTGGSPEQGLALRQAIEKITSTPICYVVNTHVHPDHIYGNKAFKTKGIRFIGHHNLPRAIAARGQYYVDKAREQLAIQVSPDDLVAPDTIVKEVLTLDLGGRELLITAHPAAHTDNDLSLYDKQTDTLWLADLLFLEHLPVLDGSLRGWLSELEKLEKRRVQRVIPGHGPVVTDWPQAMQPQKAYLKQLQTEIRALLKQRKFLEEAVNSVGLSAKKDWLLFDEFHRKNVTTAFAELEWED